MASYNNSISYGLDSAYPSSTSEMAGNITKITKRITSETMNGATPRNISLSLICGAIALITKIFIPIGGVIKPSSTVNTAMMPNQTGSNPNARMMGYTTGMVITSIAKASMNSPNRKYMNRIQIKTIIGLTANPPIQDAKV